MANLYWNLLNITGEPEKINQFIETAFTTENEPTKTWLMLPDDDELSLDQIERWAPHGLQLGFIANDEYGLLPELAAVSARFPDLYFGLAFEEPGNLIFGSAGFSAGETRDEEWCEDVCDEADERWAARPTAG